MPQKKYWEREVTYEVVAWGMGLEEDTNIFVYMPQGIEARQDGKTWIKHNDVEIEISSADRVLVLEELKALSRDRMAQCPTCDRIIANGR